MSEPVAAYDGEREKQDCERKAFVRNCKNLKSVRYPKTLKHLGGGSHFGDSELKDVWFQSYPTNFADCVDAFGGTPHFGRIVYPRGDAGWEKYIADQQARDNFVAWADAGSRTNDYLAAFSDRQKPIGYVLMHPDSEFGRTYKWLVPRNFGVGMILLVQ